MKSDRNKTAIRITAATIILVATGYILFWYLLHKREVPQHARVVPSDAIAVVNLNIPNLADDYSNRTTGIDSASSLFGNELSSIIGDINQASGLVLGSDVILFMYQSGDAAYFGVALDIEDSALFGKRIRSNNQIEFRPWNDHGFPVMRIDTTPGVIGWTESTALLIYPFSNHGVAHTSVQCIELLKQKEEKSVIANENYKSFALGDFDAAIWIQPKSLLKFTDNGDLFRQTFSGIEYVNYTFEFDEGKINGRSEWTLPNATRIGAPVDMPLPAEGKEILGMIRFDLDINDTSLYSSFVDAPPLNALPLTDEESTSLLPYLTGECAICLFDTIADEHASGSSMRRSREFAERGYSFSFLLRDGDKADEILSEIMTRDSIPRNENTWYYKESGSDVRMSIDGNLLSVTNSPDADGRRHEMPLFLQRKQFWFDVKRLTVNPAPFGLLSWFLPSYPQNHKFISEMVKQANGTTPAQLNNMMWSTFEIEFTDTKTNGLVQLEKLILRSR
jgi:hypothetical protein